MRNSDDLKVVPMPRARRATSGALAATIVVCGMVVDVVRIGLPAACAFVAGALLGHFGAL